MNIKSVYLRNVYIQWDPLMGIHTYRSLGIYIIKYSTHITICNDINDLKGVQ